MWKNGGVCRVLVGEPEGRKPLGRPGLNGRIVLRFGHTERGLPQRTAVSVRCGMLHSKQTFNYYILKAQFLSNKKKPLAF